MSHILSGLEGVICPIDNVLIIETNQSEHDQRLHAELSRLQGARVTLNGDKCLFVQTQIKFLGKFTYKLSEVSQPLQELLSPKRAWLWGSEQECAFALVKEELTQPTVLAHYNPSTMTKVSSDTSSFGLGAALLKQSQDSWKPVAYTLWSMTETEWRYA